MKRGDKVKFKGNEWFKPLEETYVWAVGEHMVTMYWIQHPDGGHDKESIAYNNGMGDGFESPYSYYFEEGLHYICVMPNEVLKID